MRITFVLLPTLLLTLFVGVSAQDWQSIIPLKTTRTEVEALLGQADTDYFAIYQLKEGSLFIEYSSGPCQPARKGGWNVAKNVVVSVTFSPKKKQRLSDLKLNRKKFKRVVDKHLGGIIYYISEEDGIVYEIQDGKVERVEHEPPKKYDHLQCPDLTNTSSPGT